MISGRIIGFTQKLYLSITIYNNAFDLLINNFSLFFSISDVKPVGRDRCATNVNPTPAVSTEPVKNPGNVIALKAGVAYSATKISTIARTIGLAKTAEPVSIPVKVHTLAVVHPASPAPNAKSR